jgi:anti-sigma B factor antagonist
MSAIAAPAPAPAPAEAEVFAPEGELTIRTAAAMRDAMQQAIDAGCTAFDLSRVEAFDTAGLQLLVAAQRALDSLGSPLVLRGATEPVRSLVGLYRLDKTLELQP